MAQGIIGLGNPGPEYRNTRHNVGQRVVDRVARQVHARFSREGGHPLAKVEWRGQPLYLIKPTAFMNVSGPAVARLARRLHLAPSDLILVFDDIDLPLGKVRVRMKGSAGGHNGVRSVIEMLGTDVFRRVKVGIGRPAPPGQHKDLVVDHVLSPFYADEADTVEAACAEAADLALKLVETHTADPS
ncbi:MAG TPA: aminoacyl-tRNA hydrolase [Methylomirabilota bacterium]|nr:aminoacyl-tRNA hydrolase [Methylomirabilota bacterium]